MALISGKLTKALVKTLGAGRHGDGNGLYLVVDPSGARRWVVRVTVKGQKNKQGKPLRTDFGLGGANLVLLHDARARALEYRRLAKQGINPRFSAGIEIPCFEEVAQQVHIERMPAWKNPKHGQQWIGPVPVSCRSSNSVKRLKLRKPVGFSSLKSNAFAADYRNR